ncbi:hypothetical protein [Streptomyces phaeofaciens]|nr:hypothetical protein [Streptomyces phaeofaciens]
MTENTPGRRQTDASPRSQPPQYQRSSSVLSSLRAATDNVELA